MTDEHLNTTAQQWVDAYLGDLQKRPKRADRSWSAIERRIEANDPLLYSDDFEADAYPNPSSPTPGSEDELDVHRRRRDHRGFAVAVIAASCVAATLALFAGDLRTVLTDGIEEPRPLHASAFSVAERPGPASDTDETIETPERRSDTDASSPATVARRAPRVLDLHSEQVELLTRSLQWSPATAGVRTESAPVVLHTKQTRRRPKPSSPHRRARTGPEVKPVATPDSTIAEEAALLAQARRALRDGKPRNALSYATQHARSFPNGSLAPERAMLKVAALCAAGERLAARNEAEAFTARFPASPLRARVLRLCPEE